MPLVDALISAVAALLDKIIPNPKAREAARLELARLDRVHELDLLKAQVAAIVVEANSSDPWTSRARPG